MTDSSDRRIRSIVQAAIELEPESRTAFLNQACANRPDMRLEIERRLRLADRDSAPTMQAEDDAEATSASGALPHSGQEYKAGDRLGHYEILFPIGQGGMGVVFCARDTRLEREVALKILPPEFSGDPERRRRFLREARAASQLNHPNIVTIYDVAESGSAHFIAMEYVKGQTLARSIPLTPDAAIDYASQIAQALVKAHAQGVVHRDLKPANIMLTPDGLAKVLDFGLASQTARGPFSDQTLTDISQAGAVLGTPAYMSPEQAEGKQVDAQSDIFSFGAVLYEMLSGQKAFQGATPISILASVLRDEPKPLGEVVPGVWPELGQVVERCLRKDKAARFQNISEVLRELQTARRQRSPAQPGKAPTLAVLPFANMSPDKENEYFSDGLAEEIIGALSRLPGLKVTARTSAFAFKGKTGDIQTVAAALHVDHVLEGSVRMIGNRIRVTAQLISARDGDHVWSERYDRQLDDIFAIQDEISQAIVAALKVKLARDEPIVRRPTSNMEAYQAYLEGRFHLFQLTPDAMERGRQLLERAIGLDPAFALPHVAMADYYYYKVGLHGLRPHEFMPKVLESAERAIELDPSAGDAYVARAMYRTFYSYDWDGAGEDFSRAIGLSPSSAVARYRHAYFYLRPLGRFKEAMEENERAFALDPLSMMIRFGTATLSFMLNDNERAVQQARASLALYPNSWLGCWLTGQIFAYVGLFEEAEEILGRGLKILPDNALLLATLAMSRNLEGKPEAAAALHARLEELSGKGYISPCAIYVSYINDQDVDQAYRRLSYAIEQRDPFSASTMRDFEKAFRGHPLYGSLLKQLNLPAPPPKR